MSAPRSTRGTADRGTGSQPERNVKRARVYETVPDQTYDIRGFDIGSADLHKADIRKQLEPAIQQIHARMGQFPSHPVIRVTGHASDSVRPGKGAQHYAASRAAEVKNYLVSRGIPGEWIETTTSRETASGSSSKASPDAKAAARGATLEIGMTPHRRDVVDRFGDVTYSKLQPSWWPPKVPDFPELPDLPRLPRPNWRKWGRRALENIGEHAIDGMGILVAGGGLIRRRLVRLALRKILEIAMEIYGRELGPDAVEYVAKKVRENVHQHHVLVQKLVQLFAEAGINVHDYTQFMPESVHQWLHRTGWNQVWYTYFEVFQTLAGRPPEAEEIAEFLAQMMEHWGIADLPLEPYLKKSVPR